MTANSLSMAAWKVSAIKAWWDPHWPGRPTSRATASPDAADLAAAYAYGIVKNHGFLDGYKRTVWVTARLFLADNDRRLEFNPIDAIRTIEGVAASRIGETELANWFRSHMTRDGGTSTSEDFNDS